MRNAILGWGGIFIVVFSFYLHFDVLYNSDNNTYWKDRQYVITEKIVGAHEYKGQIKEDHYIKYYYIDEPKTIWTSQVSGVDFHSKIEHQTYTKRTPKNEDQLDRLNVWLIVFCLIGVVIMSIGIAASSKY